MAIYHFHIQSIGRSNNKSAVAAAAYRSGTNLTEVVYDDNSNLSFEQGHDYSFKKGIIFSKIYTPFDELGLEITREELWNNVQLIENRRNSVFAKDIDLALPVELTIEENISLLESFVKDTFISDGLIADVNFHNDNENNPHAHIMLTTRELSFEDNELAFGKKIRKLDNKNYLKYIREMWAVYANKHLKEYGYEDRISHESFKDRDIKIEPTLHVGVTHHITHANLVKKNQEIIQGRYEDIRNNPGKIIDSLSINKPVFTKIDLLKEVTKYVEVNKDNQNENALVDHYISYVNDVLLSRELVLVADKNFDGEKIYTSRKRLELEQEFLKIAYEIKVSEISHRLNKTISDIDEVGLKENFIKNAKKLIGLNPKDIQLYEEQKNVVLDVLNGENISIVQGFPGAGKTTVMKEVVRQYKGEGYEVVGAAISSTAARILSEETGIFAQNITKWRKFFEEVKGKDFVYELGIDQSNQAPKEEGANSYLTDKHVFIVDEASMVDLGQMHYILGEVKTSGAKLILIGDSNQLPAVGVQGAFEKLASIFDKTRLDKIYRQKDNLHRQASEALGNHDIDNAIEIYQKTGVFVKEKDNEAVIERLSNDFVEKYISIAKNKGNDDLVTSKSIIALAYQNIEVNQINNKVRNRLRDIGVIYGKEIDYLNSDGKLIKLAVGDQVVITENSKSLGLNNGDVASILEIMEDRIILKVSQGNKYKKVVVSTQDRFFKGIDYGYAITVHKSQGGTYDHVLGLMNSQVGYNIFNVMATRHREEFKCYLSDELVDSYLLSKIEKDRETYNLLGDEEAITKAAITGMINKRSNTSFASDYIDFDQKEEFVKLDQYLEIRSEMINLRAAIEQFREEEKEKGKTVSFDKTPFYEDFKGLYIERGKLANDIVNNIERYEPFISKANLNMDTLLKHAGLKKYDYEYKLKTSNTGNNYSIEEIEKLKEHITAISNITILNSRNKEIILDHKNEIIKLITAIGHSNYEIQDEISIKNCNLNDLSKEFELKVKAYNSARIYTDQEFGYYLDKTFKDKDIAIKNWENLVKEHGIENSTKQIQENPQILSKLKGIGFASLAITKDRLRAQINTDELSNKFIRFEESKKYIANTDLKAEANKCQNEKNKLEGDIKKLENNLLAKETNHLIDRISKICSIEDSRKYRQEITSEKILKEIDNIVAKSQEKVSNNENNNIQAKVILNKEKTIKDNLPFNKIHDYYTKNNHLTDREADLATTKLLYKQRYLKESITPEIAKSFAQDAIFTVSKAEELLKNSQINYKTIEEEIHYERKVLNIAMLSRNDAKSSSKAVSSALEVITKEETKLASEVGIQENLDRNQIEFVKNQFVQYRCLFGTKLSEEFRSLVLKVAKEYPKDLETNQGFIKNQNIVFKENNHEKLMAHVFTNHQLDLKVKAGLSTAGADHNDIKLMQTRSFERSMRLFEEHNLVIDHDNSDYTKTIH